MSANEVVVVTGASGAIGSEVVRTLRSDGRNVVAVAGRPGSDCDAVLDVSNEDAVVSFFTDLTADGALIAGLANVAGINIRSEALDCTAETFMRNVEVNLLGTFLMCREAARAMADAGTGGSVVNVSSTMAFVGSKRSQSAYAATKGGVNALTTALAVEWAALGIRVNAVAPTFTDTPMNAPISSDPDRSAAVLANIPLGRFGQPSDTASAIAWLLGPHSSFVTGDVLRVDGGYLAI